MTPTPYYEGHGITLYCGDMRTILPHLFGSGQLDDVGCVFADTPYAQTSCSWDKWPIGWPGLLARALPVTTPMWVCGSLRMFLDRRDEFEDWKLSQDLVWEKHNGSSFHADRFRRVHESLTLWYRGDWNDVQVAPVKTMDATKRTVRRKKRPAHMGNIEASAYESHDGGPRLMTSVIRVRSCHGDGGENETRKPLGLVEPLLQYTLKPGSVLLDPFCGEGSSLVVAKQRGHRAIGIDLRPRQCEATARKLDSVLSFG